MTLQASNVTSRLRPIDAGEIIQDSPEVISPTVVDPKVNAVAWDLLLLSLKALSQRTLSAIANLWSLGAIASVWVLWYELISRALPAPTVNLAGASIYSMFVLAVLWLRRRGP